MQKKLIALSFMLFTVLNNSIVYGQGGIDNSGIKAALIIGGLSAVGGAGNYATDMNKEYSEKKKRPDFKMRAAKAVGAGAVIIGTDLLLGDTSSTMQKVAKVTAYSVSLLGITDTAGDLVRAIPLVGGLLTDPVDEDGREIKDSGACARVLLLYIPLRDLMLKAC